MPLYELGRSAMRSTYELITQSKVEDITVTDPPHATKHIELTN